MDTVAIALSVSILIVLVTLCSCWKGKQSMVSGMMSHNEAHEDDDDKEESDVFYSSSGAGVQNRQLAAQYKDLQNVSSYGDYNELVQYASLEPSVFQSQDEYAAENNNSTSGASMMSTRSDDNDVVPWVGLRRPKYDQVYAQSDARVVHSDYPDQMPAATSYVL